MRAGSRRSREVTRAGAGDGWRMLFWTTFARSANPMSVLTSDRRFAAVNRAFVALSGYTREQLVGGGLDLLLAPEEWRSLDAEWRELEHLGEIEGERTIVTAEGERIAVQYARRWVVLDNRHLVLTVINRGKPRADPHRVKRRVAGERAQPARDRDRRPYRDGSACT